jgi:hypothetical protein
MKGQRWRTFLTARHLRTALLEGVKKASAESYWIQGATDGPIFRGGVVPPNGVLLPERLIAQMPDFRPIRINRLQIAKMYPAWV